MRRNGRFLKSFDGNITPPAAFLVTLVFLLLFPQFLAPFFPTLSDCAACVSA